MNAANELMAFKSLVEFMNAPLYDFDDVLNLYPEFLRPNIINILNYLKEKKHSNCCHKMMIYTNNNGPKEWANKIVKYFEKMLIFLRVA